METYRNREWLYNEYITLGKTCSEISRQLGCSAPTISNWLRKLHIKREGVGRRGGQLSQKHFHPAEDELRYLYIECDHTSKEIADLYGIPQYTVTFVLHNYGIKKHDRHSKRRKDKLKELEEKGLTKEKLYDLYINEKMTLKEIGERYNEHHQYVYILLGLWEIPKRSRKEATRIVWDKKLEEKTSKNRSFVHKKIDEIKNDIKAGKIDPSKITHQKACILLSCNPGIEKLKKLCDLYGFDFEILANTYRKLEPIWFKLNLYPLINAKIALTLYLRYKISQHICCEICHTTEVSFRTFYKILSKKIKLTKEKREDPLTLINIRWLFDNPDLPEIYKTLFTFRENYSGYYCNIDNEDCEYFEDWNHRCYKPLYSSCQYAFCKYKSREDKLDELRTEHDKKEEKDNA